MSTHEDYDDLKSTANGYAQRGIDTAKNMSSTAYDKAYQATRASQGYYNQLRDTTKHHWSNSPPLRWITYIVAGFFGFWAFIAFLPVIAFLVFISFILAGFGAFVWGGIYVVNLILSKFGLVERKNPIEYVKQGREHFKQ